METRRLAVSLVDRRDGWTIESLSSLFNPTKFQEDKELGKLEIIRGIWQTSDPNVQFERNPTLKHLLISFDSLKISRRTSTFDRFRRRSLSRN